MSSAQAQVQKDHPLMKAWEAHKETEEYANSKKWAANERHVDGSLWALFVAGWNAGTAAAFGMEVIAGPAAAAALDRATSNLTPATSETTLTPDQAKDKAMRGELGSTEMPPKQVW